MKITDTLDVTTRAGWRRWLEKHHQTAREIWLVYHKKGSGKARVAYDDAVEEALCFGWIDGLVKSIDEERYAQRFTPRKPGSSWSKLNVERVRKLSREGLMTPAGLATISPEILDGSSSRIVDQDGWEAQSAVVEESLRCNPEALDNFRGLAPSYRKQYVLWITSARKDQTRRCRLEEAIARLARNEKLGMK